MSSPSQRRTRGSQSGTPRRTARQSESNNTPQNGQPGASSPLFFQSSPAPNGDNQDSGPSAQVSSPLRQMSNSQSTQQHESQDASLQPSSPLRQMTESQEVANDGNRTPRASGQARPSSPLRYDPSSSPGQSLRFPQSDARSESSGLFLRSQRGSGGARYTRGDIGSDYMGANRTPARRVLVDDEGRFVRQTGAPASDAMTFSNRDPNTSEADALGGTDDAMMWGTTISIQDSLHVFRDFVRNFAMKYRLYRDGLTDEEVRDHPMAESKIYYDSFETMMLLGKTTYHLNLADLNLYPPTRKLFHHAQVYPSEMIPVFDQVIKDFAVEWAAAESSKMNQHSNSASQQVARESSEPVFPSSDRPDEPGTPGTPRPRDETSQLEQKVEKISYYVRVFGLENATNMRELNPSDVDKLVSVKGLVIRATPVIPDMTQAHFRCNECGNAVTSLLERGKIREPTECSAQDCKAKNSMQIVHNRCEFQDKQVIKLQETPDSVPPGQTPHSVSVVAHHEFVDFCKAGDRVEITGIFRVNPVRVNPRQRALKSVHKTYVDMCHVKKVDSKRMDADPTTLGVEDQEEGEEEGMEQARKVNPEEEEKIRATAARDDIYDLLSRSLAPSIYEMDDVKKGILLQLFGGANKTFQKGGSPKYRGDINVLLCGDPSTSKSQMLAYVHKIAPRGVYTSGKGSSAVGLTAYVTRDPESRQLVLESGALVLSDGGVCCIDEFDKMSDSTRSVLHEVMEQQTISVAKAGIITTLNARTSILASANPIGSRYNPDMSVPQNIDLPPTLLSRFDLIYLILDRVDEKADRRLARHLLSLYLEDKPDSAAQNNDILPVEFLTLYISYARSQIQPVISQEAAQELVDSYLEMRALGQDVRSADKRITATTRQLESMIRLSEAHAKMRLSERVTKDDVREAYRLIQSALKTAATDSQGRIDMSLLTEGTSAADRKRQVEIKDALQKLLDDMTSGGQAVRWGDVSRRLSEGSSLPVETAEFNEAMRALEAEGAIMVAGEGARRNVRRVTAVG